VNKPMLMAETAVALPARETMSLFHFGNDFSFVSANNYGANNFNAGFVNIGNTVGSEQGSQVLVIQG